MAAILDTRCGVIARFRILAVAIVLVWPVWCMSTALADEPNPCQLIAANTALPSPSIAADDRYAQLATMFSGAPGLRNLPIRRIVESSELRRLLDRLDHQADSAGVSGPIGDARASVADSLQAAIDREATGGATEDPPFTEHAQVFEVGRPADGNTTDRPGSFFVIAELAGLVAVELRSGTEDETVRRIRALGDFDRFGAFEWGGEAWLFRVLRGASGGANTLASVAMYRLGAEGDAAGTAMSGPVCEGLMATDTAYSLVPSIAPGARAPNQDLMKMDKYVVTSLLARTKPFFSDTEKPRVHVYNSRSGASREISGEAPGVVIAREAGLDPELVARRLQEIWPGGGTGTENASNSEQPANIRDLIGGIGSDPGLLVLVESDTTNASLCAVYGSSGTSRLDAFISLLNDSRLVGTVACTVLSPLGASNDASEAILANRAAEDRGDGFAYWILERDVVIGLPSPQ